jgi:cyclic 2,3-diphosphoglycerate synthase
MRVLALVDGEHYPTVTRWGLESARSMGHDVVAALFVGGTEKIAASGPPDLGVPTRVAGPSRRRALEDAIDELAPEGVLDLSDEPVLGYRERMELAAVALVRGVPYLGSDFRLDPPVGAPPRGVPTVAVIGTGKRTGKTAISGEVARTAAAAGLRPVIVAMGRGGPPEPQVAEAGSVTLERLAGLVADGQHAASDYLEDALTAGVTAIGARRCGGGLAGAPFVTNVREAAELALRYDPGLVILEGSGSSIPPMPWDAGVLVTPAHVPEEYLGGYLGPYRILRADLVVVTMATGPNPGPGNLSALRSHVQRLHEDARFAVTDFQPVPLGDVQRKAVYLATTSPDEVAARQAEHLQRTAGCRVVGVSSNLADRAALAADLDAAPDYDVLLTELKAAAVDVAAAKARERGADVVFVDNRPVDVASEAATVSLREGVDEVLALAVARHAERA